MREKELRFVVTFHTTAEAMATEKLCREKAIRTLHFECHWRYRDQIPALRSER